MKIYIELNNIIIYNNKKKYKKQLIKLINL
jgi:hypothetical protein